MASTKKAHHTATKEAASDSPEVLDTVTNLYAQGMDRLADVQKKGLDLATQQNAELLDSWKKISTTIPTAPGQLMLDLVSNAFERYASTQKGAIDLVLTQSHALLGVVKESAASTTDALEKSDAIVARALEHTVREQKKALDESAAFTKASFQRAKSQMGVAGTPAEAAADTLQRGVEALTQSQKELLDYAATPLRARRTARTR